MFEYGPGTVQDNLGVQYILSNFRTPINAQYREIDQRILSNHMRQPRTVQMYDEAEMSKKSCPIHGILSMYK